MNFVYVWEQNYDMVVADTTIWAPRASFVDFTLPYSESGMVLVVNNNRPLNMWIVFKPLSWDLWLTILAASAVMGGFIWILERQAAQQIEQPEAAADPAQQVEQPAAAPGRNQDEEPNGRINNAFLVPFKALAFPESNYSNSICMLELYKLNNIL